MCVGVCMCVCVCVCVDEREIKKEVLDPCLLVSVTSVTEPAEEADCVTCE